MVFLRCDLCRQCDQKEPEEYCRADCIANLQSHRESISARFSQRSGTDFYDPEGQGDLRDLGCEIRFFFRNAFYTHVLADLFHLPQMKPSPNSNSRQDTTRACGVPSGSTG